LKRQTGAKGALFKPEGQLLPYLGDKWNGRYDKAYGARTKVGGKAGKAIVGLAKVMRDYRRGWQDGDGRRDFQTRLAKVLDVDEFLQYLAVTVLIGNGDSPMLFPHNYYLGVSNKSRQVLMLPWDLNNSIGGMGQFMGISFVELSIYQPTSVPLMVRVLEVPEFKERYTKIVRELIQGPCSAQRMTAAYHAAKKTVASAIAEEATRSKIVTGGSGGSGKGKLYGKKARPVDLERFFVAREKSVLDQLAGRSQGVTLEGGRKGGGKKGAGKKGGGKKGGGKGTGKKFDAKAYLAGAKKKFKAMVEAGQMTAEEARAKIAELKKKLKGSSKGSKGKGKKL
jgi:hypothetical protein